ncbi:MAG: magnesium transporter [Rhodospirillales bacterium]|nr:magnesium transporter [Rhodospirillales bacterium]
MLTVYRTGERGLERVEGGRLEGVSSPAWIDLFNPTQEEIQQVQAALKIEIPSREEMVEIETSSRLYKDGDGLFMTALLLVNSDTANPGSTAVTFILTGGRLVTLRYADPLPFRSFPSHLARHSKEFSTGETAFVGLLEEIIDRIADILERVGLDIDRLSLDVFNPATTTVGMGATQQSDLKEVLRRLGRNGDLTSKARESLVSIGRLLTFATQACEASAQDLRRRFETQTRDVQSLSDHANFLSNKVNFILSATLGMINVEQNTIIKIFSVAAVAFLPPTLVASIYGMNFQLMPELQWPWGYPLAIVLMILSAVLPYLYFKRRGWL